MRDTVERLVYLSLGKQKSFVVSLPCMSAWVGNDLTEVGSDLPAPDEVRQLTEVRRIDPSLSLSLSDTILASSVQTDCVLQSDGSVVSYVYALSYF